MLTVDQMIELEILARGELERLEKESTDAREDSEAVSPDNSIGRLSRLDAMQMQEMALEAQRRRDVRMQQIREALERMDAGTYGTCELCRNTIEYDRLSAYPEATVCGKCRR